jgi:hypothetical protein
MLLLASVVTPEQKRKELAARAKALWEAREAERQAKAQALLELRYRCAAHSTVGKTFFILKDEPLKYRSISEALLELHFRSAAHPTVGLVICPC